MLSVEYSLQDTARPAQVFTLQLGWQKEHESSSDILNTMTTISEVALLETSLPSQVSLNMHFIYIGCTFTVVYDVMLGAL